VEKFCILLWQARVGREIERYKSEKEEEMGTEEEGMRELLSYEVTPCTVGCGKSSEQLYAQHG
jgi:hypothetical protein